MNVANNWDSFKPHGKKTIQTYQSKKKYIITCKFKDRHMLHTEHNDKYMVNRVNEHIWFSNDCLSMKHTLSLKIPLNLNNTSTYYRMRVCFRNWMTYAMNRTIIYPTRFSRILSDGVIKIDQHQCNKLCSNNAMVNYRNYMIKSS